MSLIVCQIIEVCVFRFANDRAEYLMLRRSPAEKIYPGLWQFVTGSLNDGETAIDGALRELKEETGLTPDRFWVVPHVSTFYDPAYDAVNMSPLFAAQVNAGNEPALSSEHSVHEWLPYADACRRLVWPAQREGLEIVGKYIMGGEQAGVLTEISL